jgi:septum formation protein
MRQTVTKLLLASSSPYRRALLEQLNLSAEYESPSIDETPSPGESAADLANRLAQQKAEALKPQFPNYIIIGSDQSACVDDRLLNKPGSHDKALAQLSACSGRLVTFYTGLCVYHGPSGQSDRHLVITEVAFRQLKDAQIPGDTWKSSNPTTVPVASNARVWESVCSRK